MKSCLLSITLLLFCLGWLVLLQLTVVCTLVTTVVGAFFIATRAYVGVKLIPRGKVSPVRKSVFITGCDTGFGHGLAIALDRLGYHVFAGCYCPDHSGAQQLTSETSDMLTIVPCDVTSDVSVSEAQKFISEQCAKRGLGLWAVVNNAGTWRRSEIEWTTMQQFKDQAEVNLYGTVRVSKTFLRMLRQSKGRVINVSSISGMWTCPSGGPYSMTKYAVEAFSDALRYEMKRFGVKVTIIEPGNFTGSTHIGDSVALEQNIWDNMDSTTKEDYGRNYIHAFVVKMQTYVRNSPNKNMIPVLNAMVDAVSSCSPKHRYLVAGVTPWTTYYLTYSNRLLPSWITDFRAFKDLPFLPKLSVFKKKEK